MARIPISEIPNAPQVGAPVLANRPSGISAAIPTDLGGGLDSSGIQRAQGELARGADSIAQSSNLVARATAGMKQDYISDEPARAMARAGAFVGEALTHAGNVATSYAQDMMRAKNTVDMTRVDTILRDARDGHELEIEQQQLSPDKWVPSWNEKQADVMTKIQALKLRPEIQGQVQADVAQFWGQQTNRFALDATRKSISDARDETKVSVQRAFDDGDWETADKTISEGVKSKIFSEAEGEQFRMQLESKQRDNLVNTAVSADPKAVLDDMQEAKKTGESSAFPWLDAAQRIRVESMAENQFRGNQASASDALDQDILTGKVTTPEQIREIAEQHDLPEREIQSQIKSLNVVISQSPAGQAVYKANRTELRTLVAAYDPANDPKQDQYYALKDRIRGELAEGDRDELLDDARKKRDSGMTPSARQKATLFSSIDDMKSQGILGDQTIDPKTKKVKDWSAFVAVNQKADELKDQVQDFLEKHPNATNQEATDFFKTMMRSEPAANASKLFQPQTSTNWFQSWGKYAFPFGAGVNAIKDSISGTPVTKDTIDQKLKGQDMSGFIRGGSAGGNTTPTKDGAMLDQKTIDFVKDAEGFNPGSFSDYAQTSIGYGTRAKPGEKTITKDEADARLKSELAMHATRVDKAIAQSGLNLTPNQRAALISFDFNTGAGANVITSSDSIEEIAARLPLYNKVTVDGKKVINKGLVNRRAKELELFAA